MPNRNINPRIAGLACLVIILATIAHYAHTLNTFLLNAPDSDDYVDVLWFFEVFLGAENISGKLYALFLPIHEHITVTSHLIYILDYFIFGKINFIHYILVGQLIIFSICLVVAAAKSKSTGWPLALMLSVVFYYNLHFWHSSFWAMTAISNQVVILFGLLAALTLSKKPDDIRLPLLFAIMGSFSQANGLAIFIAIALCLILNARQQQKTPPYKKLLIVIIPFIFILGFHLVHQNPFRHIHHLDHQAMMTEPELIHLYQRDVSGTNRLHANPAQALLTFFAVSGASFLDKDQYVFSIILGISIFACWIYFLCIAKKAPDLFTVAALIFVLISISLIATGRGSYGGDIAAMQPRYRMYSSLLILLTVFQWLETRPGNKSLAAVLLLGFCIQISGVNIHSEARKNHKMLTSSYYYWLIDGGFGRSTMHIYPPNQDRRLFIAWRSGRYHPIEAIPAQHRPLDIRARAVTPECSAPSTTVSDARITAYSKKPKAIAVELTLDLPGTPPDTKQGPTLLLCNDTRQYEVQLGALNYAASRQQWQPLIILKSELPPGNYKTLLRQGDSPIYLGDIGFK